MITITLTEDEARIIKEDIESTFEYLDTELGCNQGIDAPWNSQEREDAIKDAHVCKSILNKLGVK